MSTKSMAIDPGADHDGIAEPILTERKVGGYNPAADMPTVVVFVVVVSRSPTVGAWRATADGYGQIEGNTL